MEFLTDLNTLLIQDLGLTQELANIACGVVVGMSLFLFAILYFYILMGLGYLLGYLCFKPRYYLVNIKNEGFLIEKHFYFSKRRIKSIEKKFGPIVFIERFDNKELLFMFILTNDYDFYHGYLGKDYKLVYAGLSTVAEVINEKKQ